MEEGSCAAESILDMCCGDGRLTTFLAYHTQRKVVGLDVSSRGSATARKTRRKTVSPNWWSECKVMAASWPRCGVSSLRQ